MWDDNVVDQRHWRRFLLGGIDTYLAGQVSWFFIPERSLTLECTLSHYNTFKLLTSVSLRSIITFSTDLYVTFANDLFCWCWVFPSEIISLVFSVCSDHLIIIDFTDFTVLAEASYYEFLCNFLYFAVHLSLRVRSSPSDYLLSAQTSSIYMLPSE
jgi:hypothetical protein